MRSEGNQALLGEESTEEEDDDIFKTADRLGIDFGAWRNQCLEDKD